MIAITKVFYEQGMITNTAESLKRNRGKIGLGVGAGTVAAGAHMIGKAIKRAGDEGASKVLSAVKATRKVMDA